MVYADPPWVFKGRALYQLQLVKSEEAKKYIPDYFKIVDFCGYTLGGFYLARYDDSPVGPFDELVTLAGIVWDPPTSCAWAGRVYVNNREARDHGLMHVGLPSRLASFSEVSEPASASGQKCSWWRQEGGRKGDQGPAKTDLVCIRNVEKTRQRGLAIPVCTFALPNARGTTEFAGPRITLPLPSFSGATPEVHGLLKYACQLHTNVRFVSPARVLLSELSSSGSHQQCSGGGEDMACILGGKPLITVAFDNMEMFVGAPERLQLASETKKQSAGKLASASLVQAWAAGRSSSFTTTAGTMQKAKWASA